MLAVGMSNAPTKLAGLPGMEWRGVSYDACLRRGDFIIGLVCNYEGRKRKAMREFKVAEIKGSGENQQTLK